jgi:hypothetical protein
MKGNMTRIRDIVLLISISVLRDTTSLTTVSPFTSAALKAEDARHKRIYHAE